MHHEMDCDAACCKAACNADVTCTHAIAFSDNGCQIARFSTSSTGVPTGGCPTIAASGYSVTSTVYEHNGRKAHLQWLNDNPSHSEDGCEAWSKGKDLAWCESNIAKGAESSTVRLPSSPPPPLENGSSV